MTKFRFEIFWSTDRNFRDKKKPIPWTPKQAKNTTHFFLTHFFCTNLRHTLYFSYLRALPSEYSIFFLRFSILHQRRTQFSHIHTYGSFSGSFLLFPIARYWAKRRRKRKEKNEPTWKWMYYKNGECEKKHGEQNKKDLDKKEREPKKLVRFANIDSSSLTLILSILFFNSLARTFSSCFLGY